MGSVSHRLAAQAGRRYYHVVLPQSFPVLKRANGALRCEDSRGCQIKRQSLDFLEVSQRTEILSNLLSYQSAGVRTSARSARRRKATIIKTVVLPAPVGIVTMAGCLDPKKCDATACAAAIWASRNPGRPLSLMGELELAVMIRKIAHERLAGRLTAELTIEPMEQTSCYNVSEIEIPSLAFALTSGAAKPSRPSLNFPLPVIHLGIGGHRSRTGGKGGDRGVSLPSSRACGNPGYSAISGSSMVLIAR